MAPSTAGSAKVHVTRRWKRRIFGGTHCDRPRDGGRWHSATGVEQTSRQPPKALEISDAAHGRQLTGLTLSSMRRSPVLTGTRAARDHDSLESK